MTIATKNDAKSTGCVITPNNILEKKDHDQLTTLSMINVFQQML